MLTQSSLKSVGAVATILINAQCFDKFSFKKYFLSVKVLCKYISLKVDLIVNKNQGDEDVQIQKLYCLGHWPSNFPGKYFAILKSETDYKCAVSIFS